jgi:glycosyltransferase involved in cell wall biosynthesis
MRMLYVITRAELGGAQSHVLDLVTAFSSRGDMFLAVGEDGPLAEAAEARGVTVRLVSSLKRSINPFRDAKAVLDVQRVIAEIKPDLVHVHSSKAGAVGRLAASRSRVPAVFTAHGWGFAPGVPLIQRWIALHAERMTAPLARRIICVSEHDRRLALRSLVGTPDSLVRIHYGIDALSNPEHRSASGVPTLIMVARFSGQKDHETILLAMKRVKEGGNEVRLLLVGSGPLLEASKSMSKNLGLDTHVSFLGDQRDVPGLLRRSDVFVLTTHYEGLPISILEAMRAGLPVIATDVDGITEQISHGKTGFLVPHRDAKSVAHSINTLVSNAELRFEFGDAARRLFLQEFTLERMIDRVGALYEDVLARN